MGKQTQAEFYDVRQFICDPDERIEGCINAINLSVYLFHDKPFSELYASPLVSTLQATIERLGEARDLGLISGHDCDSATDCISKFAALVDADTTMNDLLLDTQTLSPEALSQYETLRGIGLMLPSLGDVDPASAAEHLPAFLDQVGDKTIHWYVTGSADEETWKLIRTLHYARKVNIMATCQTLKKCVGGQCVDGGGDDKCIQNTANTCANCSSMAEIVIE